MSSIKDFPLGPPPPGQLSNFKDPETRGPAIVAVCYVSLALMWPIFLSRLYTKVFILRQFGWDDGKFSPPLTFCLLTCDDSFCHPCRSMSHFSQFNNEFESK